MKTKNDNYCRCSKCIEQEKETTPAPTPWSAKSEAYWREQYLFMYEKYHKLMRDQYLFMCEKYHKQTQTITTTEEWLITYTKGEKPHDQLFDIEADANEAFNALIQNRNCKNVMLYNITTQTTKTLQRRY